MAKYTEQIAALTERYQAATGRRMTSGGSPGIA